MCRFVQTSRLFHIAVALVALQACVGAAPQALARAQDPKCLQPVDPGPCRMNLERYYYNSQTNACETFKFGGCRGNDNKFGFRQSCEEACVGAAATATTKPMIADGNRQFAGTTPKAQISTTTSKTLAKTTPTTTMKTTAAQQHHSTSSPKPIKK